MAALARLVAHPHRHSGGTLAFTELCLKITVRSHPSLRPVLVMEQDRKGISRTPLVLQAGQEQGWEDVDMHPQKRP